MMQLCAASLWQMHCDSVRLAVLCAVSLSQVLLLTRDKHRVALLA